MLKEHTNSPCKSKTASLQPGVEQQSHVPRGPRQGIWGQPPLHAVFFATPPGSTRSGKSGRGHQSTTYTSTICTGGWKPIGLPPPLPPRSCRGLLPTLLGRTVTGTPRRAGWAGGRRRRCDRQPRRSPTRWGRADARLPPDLEGHPYERRSTSALMLRPSHQVASDGMKARAAMARPCLASSAPSRAFLLGEARRPSGAFGDQCWQEPIAGRTSRLSPAARMLRRLPGASFDAPSAMTSIAGEEASAGSRLQHCAESRVCTRADARRRVTGKKRREPRDVRQKRANGGKELSETMKPERTTGSPSYGDRGRKHRLPTFRSKPGWIRIALQRPEMRLAGTAQHLHEPISGNPLIGIFARRRAGGRSLTHGL